LLPWIEAQSARMRGEEQRALRLEATAAAAGSSLARRARVARILTEARTHHAEGRLDKAERAFENALEAGSDPVPALLGLGLVAFERGLMEDARSALERAVAVDPDVGETWNLLGIVRQRIGDSRDAQRAFLRALDASPFLPQALANTGLIAAQQGDESRAREMLRRLQDTTPRGVAASEEEKALQQEIELHF
jgi:Flp pilus assembly protein TadD